MAKIVGAPLFGASGSTSTGAAPNPITLNNPAGSKVAIQGTVAGTGAVSATIIVSVTLDGNLLDVATITLSGTTTASDGVALDLPWASITARISALAGTGATANCFIGAQ